MTAHPRLLEHGYTTHWPRVPGAQRCDNCKHVRLVATKLRPLELTHACGLHRATVAEHGCCELWRRATQ